MIKAGMQFLTTTKILVILATMTGTKFAIEWFFLKVPSSTISFFTADLYGLGKSRGIIALHNFRMNVDSYPQEMFS